MLECLHAFCIRSPDVWQRPDVWGSWVLQIRKKACIRIQWITVVARQLISPSIKLLSWCKNMTDLVCDHRSSRECTPTANWPENPARLCCSSTVLKSSDQDIKGNDILLTDLWKDSAQRLLSHPNRRWTWWRTVRQSSYIARCAFSMMCWWSSSHSFCFGYQYGSARNLQLQDVKRFRPFVRLRESIRTEGMFPSLKSSH
jgi:hypothetical protein